MPSAIKQGGTIALCILIPLLIGILSSLLSQSGIDGWYATLQKPSFNPPNWIFGPVWTLLYIMMGVALAMIVRSKHAMCTTALVFFAVQLALNFVWSPLFFALEQPLWALVDIIALLIVLLGTLIYFSRISLKAGLLLLPYLFWVSFATMLNWSIVLLN